jgi:hypothetical protein
MPDRNRLSTLNHYCQQDSQTTTQDTMTTQEEKRGPPGLRLLVYHHHSAATWVASQRATPQFSVLSPKIQTTSTQAKASQNLLQASGIPRSAWVFLQGVAPLPGSPSQDATPVQFSPVRGSASTWFASQRQLHSFLLADSQEQLLLLLLMVLVKLV